MRLLPGWEHLHVCMITGCTQVWIETRYMISATATKVERNLFDGCCGRKVGRAGRHFGIHNILSTASRSREISDGATLSSIAMKGPMNMLRRVASSSRAVSKRRTYRRPIGTLRIELMSCLALRGFATSTTRAEGVQASAGSERSSQASSSTSTSAPDSEVASEAYMEDTPEEVFRRNLRDLQAFRRRKDTESA